MANNFAKNLKIIKIHRGINLQQLADKTGIPHQTIQKYEAQLMEPNVSKLLAICTAFECDIDYLVSAELELKIEQKPLKK